MQCGTLLERLGRLLGRLEASRAPLRPSRSVLGDSQCVLGRSYCVAGVSWSLSELLGCNFRWFGELSTFEKRWKTLGKIRFFNIFGFFPFMHVKTHFFFFWIVLGPIWGTGEPS